MKRIPFVLKSVMAASVLGFAACANSAPVKTDFNKVSRQAAIMLQNRHYYEPEFNQAFSERVFDMYMETIDGGRIYLLQSDVDAFAKKYRKTLCDEIMLERSINVAEEIYEVVKKRIKEREIQVAALLEKNDFTFDSDRKLILDREKVGWAKSEEELEQIWENTVESLLLFEELRRSNIARMAEEQGKENPLKDERPAVESVKLKFKRDFSVRLNADREDLANYMISALSKSYCPHTDYFSSREMDSFQSSISTQLTGIGAVLQTEDDGATKITGIMIEGPSDKQGELQLNDRIIGVDSLNNGEMTDVMFMSISKVVELIQGEKWTEVRLKVEPAKNPADIKEIVIKRDKVEIKNDKAKGKIIDRKMNGKTSRIGVIKLPSFYADFNDRQGAHCSVDVAKILTRMVKENVDGVLLDLRGNGGGSLDEVRIMTGLFVGHGPVVTVRDSSGGEKTFFSNQENAIYNGPLVVAIDKTSASASEILAGALQDYNRAVVIGDSSTYGKGTVQKAYDLRPWLPVMEGRDRAGFLKPTIQMFYRVSGSSTQLKGVESDITLPSVYGGLEVGERFMDFALEHQKIPAAEPYKALDRSKLFLAELKANSVARVNNSIDYDYMKKDVVRLEERMEKNTQSLNKEVRKKEIDEADERTKTRNKERIERFANMQQQDIKTMDVYRLELDDLKDEKKLIKLDLENIQDVNVRMAKNDIEDLDQTPQWPSQMDVARREGLNILEDLITLSKGQKLAKAKVK